MALMSSKTLSYLYDNWAFMCLPMALLVALPLIRFYNSIPRFEWLVWIQVPIYLLHQFEEHGWPGGFKDFVNQKIFHQQGDRPLDNRGIFWINIPVVWVGFPISAALMGLSLNFGIWVIYVSLLNGTIHILGGIRFRSWNPGLIVSCFLNVPVSIYTLVVMHQLVSITLLTHIIGIIIAVLTHIAIIAYAITRLRQ